VLFRSGCSRTAAVGSVNPFDPPKLKVFEGRWVDHGAGAWQTAGKKATVCSGTPVVVLVKAVPVSEVCAVDVLPRALAALELQMSSFRASPESVSEPVKGLFGALADLRSTLGDLDASLKGVDADLAGADKDLRGVREMVAGLDLSDQKFVALLTRLEQLESDVKEVGVVAGSDRRRLDGLKAEAVALQEKADQPGLDALLVQRIGFQMADVLERLGELEAEVNGLIIRVSAMRQGIGYVQGGFAATRAK